MPKLGDTRPCRVCGERAILRIVRPFVTTLAWAEGYAIPYDVPATPMWRCERCDDRQPLDGDLEE